MKLLQGRRFKSYVLWASLASLVVLLLQDAGVITDVVQVNVYVERALQILIALGIINNPSLGLGFKDVQKNVEDAVDYDTKAK